MYPLRFKFRMKCWDRYTGILTNEIAGDCLELLGMIARIRYCGEHIELDLICDGKSGLL